MFSYAPTNLLEKYDYNSIGRNNELEAYLPLFFIIKKLI